MLAQKAYITGSGHDCLYW